MPTPTQWQRLEEIYYDTLELPESERAAFLVRACAGDKAMLQEVKSLLAARAAAHDFLAPTPSPLTKLPQAQVPEPTTRPGEMIQHYKILSLLGVGGMGEVFLAEDTRLQRKVALKLLPAQFTQDAARVRRFEQEARAVSALNHPNIITLFDLGRFEARYFMATEFIEGRTLRARLQAEGRLVATEAIEITRQIAAALQAAHAGGIVHRDIKPENVMLRHDGYVKVLDFGLAKVSEQPAPNYRTDEKSSSLTSAGMVLGTLSYMSPEQARGLPVNTRTDVFSLGVVLYEMLTGVQPFTGATASDIIASILRTDPPPLSPEFPATLQAILHKALAKEQADRYSSADEFARELKQLAEELAFQTRLADSGKLPANTIPVQTSEPVTIARASSPMLPRWVTGVTAALLVLLVLFAAQRIWYRKHQISAPDHKPIQTLAVLPFKLLGNVAGEEFLGLGMADVLIVKLSHLRQIVVRPTNAVLKYQQGDVDAGQAGRTLNVDAVLTGSVQKAGDKVRVTVQLIRTPVPGKVAQTIWSDVFSTAADDLFELQDALAAQLVQTLALHLTDDELQQLKKRYTENAQAYRLYLQGRFFQNKRTLEGYRKAIELYAQAIALDASYAPAYVNQAVCWQSLGEHNAVPAAETLALSRAALQQALKLDDTLGEAHAFLGHLARVFDWRFDVSEYETRRAMELAPNHPAVLQWRGVDLLAFGHADEAVALHQRAVEIDPLDLGARSQLCRAFYLAHRYEEAIHTGQSLIHMDGNQSAAYQFVGESYAQLGRYAEALTALQKAVELSPKSSERLAALGHAQGLAGLSTEAARAIEQLQTPTFESGRPYHLATVYTGLGNREEALHWLRQSLRARSPILCNRLKLDPKLDLVRNDPRFRDLMRQAGFKP